MTQILKPSNNDSIDCHLQKIGMGGLICKAARQTGDKTTNEVTPEICFNCPAGKIYREVGCDAVLPKIRILSSINKSIPQIENLFCKIRKRNTSLEYCRSCGLVTAETTRHNVSQARGLFEAQGFYSAYKDIEKARIDIRDGNFENAVTRSISSLESVIKVCHEKMGASLPNKKQLSELWKSTRTLLKFDEIDLEGNISKLLNTLSGVVNQLGNVRNTLGDAHGKGMNSTAVSENIAELTINLSSTLSTTIIRRFNQME